MPGSGIHLPVPFSQALQEQFSPGQSLIISGFIPTNGRFDINLASGPRATDATPRDDVPLHLSCRLNEGKIVVNFCQLGQWGKEETRLKSNLNKNEEFEIRIRAHTDKFEIFSNAKEAGSFPFKLPLGTISHLCVWGEVELRNICWEGRYYAMPYRSPIAAVPGSKIYVTGVSKPDAKQITINLLSGTGDVVFHFNPRFGEKKVVRNSQVNTLWQAEEREGGFPFHKGRTFDIVIECDSNGYQIYVDGQLFCAFNHRMPLASVHSVSIEGDLELQGVDKF